MNQEDYWRPVPRGGWTVGGGFQGWDIRALCCAGEGDSTGTGGNGSFVDPHGHVLLLTTFGTSGNFGTMRLYLLDPARAAMEPVELPPQLKDRIPGGIAWSGKRLFLWGGGIAVRSNPREPPRPPISQVDGWVYEPR